MVVSSDGGTPKVQRRRNMYSLKGAVMMVGTCCSQESVVDGDAENLGRMNDFQEWSPLDEVGAGIRRQ